MPKITFIGAGSTVFAKNLIGDILSFPELQDSTICLFDIDPDRLSTSEIVANKIKQALNAPAKIEATTDRRKALYGADYALCMIQVAGYKPGTVIDFEIPKKYGLRQTIADTLGIGGIMRALRTIPVLLDMCKDMEELCPDVYFLNYVNPMAMNCWAISRASKIKTVGLCHSVQGTAWELSKDIGVPLEEINFVCAGINHMAFYLKFERNGEDLYPLIRKVIEEGRVPEHNRVRYDVFKRFGYFVTESSEHFSEYVPWYIKRDRPDLIEKYNIPLDEYIRRCEAQIAGWEELRKRYESDEPIQVERTHEFASYIIHSIETGIPKLDEKGNTRVIYGNVPNNGLIDNLPQGCCVEVPCLVDRNGIQPIKIGSLPIQLAALMQTNINVQALTVEAALTRKKEYIYQAAMLDPHTAAELDPDQIYSLVDELIAAHGDWLPEYH
ncbi:glycoside hydrolase family 4 [Thermobaculum terrenum ATCC BAA-798]|uniref:Glycoside hydrolase family 4 n=1 Tax=Thermobaculum terrenum (strain ATCC BAA-798 / CCMEE 7001 / YNP1) TaxID=525904 RepID=D1CDQ3_THET1|nr:alpha-glucosidase/alpha-galactosidase [Thermobaculum terrenum]ACZ41059.1 glycoside hydrolase family 4 [Thermobaculum terrenum ATCC BAA-798]